MTYLAQFSNEGYASKMSVLLIITIIIVIIVIMIQFCFKSSVYIRQSDQISNYQLVSIRNVCCRRGHLWLQKILSMRVSELVIKESVSHVVAAKWAEPNVPISSSLMKHAD